MLGLQPTLFCQKQYVALGTKQQRITTISASIRGQILPIPICSHWIMSLDTPFEEWLLC